MEEQFFSGHLPAEQSKEKSACRANPARLRWGKEFPPYPSQDEQDEQCRRSCSLKGTEPGSPARRRHRRPHRRIKIRLQTDGNHEEGAQDQSGDDPCHEELPNGLVSKQGIDDKGRAGGYQNAERSTCGDCPKGEPVVVFESLHLRVGHVDHNG